MRGTGSRTFPLLMLGAVLLLALLGIVAGAASFILLRAGYGPLVWGVLPPLVLLLIVFAILGLVVRLSTSGASRRGGSSRGDRADDV